MYFKEQEVGSELKAKPNFISMLMTSVKPYSLMRASIFISSDSSNIPNILSPFLIIKQLIQENHENKIPEEV